MLFTAANLLYNTNIYKIQTQDVWDSIFQACTRMIQSNKIQDSLEGQNVQHKSQDSIFQDSLELKIQT